MHCQINIEHTVTCKIHLTTKKVDIQAISPSYTLNFLYIFIHNGTLEIRKFNSAPMCICSLCQKIIFLSVKKFKRQISHVHLHNPYMFVKVLRKNDIARGRCKKTKHV
jgi:hypothetical protein